MEDRYFVVYDYFERGSNYYRRNYVENDYFASFEEAKDFVDELLNCSDSYIIASIRIYQCIMVRFEDGV